MSSLYEPTEAGQLVTWRGLLPSAGYGEVLGFKWRRGRDEALVLFAAWDSDPIWIPVSELEQVAS